MIKKHNSAKTAEHLVWFMFLLEIPPLKDVILSESLKSNTPTNELIEAILEKSHKFTVGFPFNTRVKTLNH